MKLTTFSYDNRSAIQCTEVRRLIGTNLRRKSAHAHTFGGDFELKIPRMREFCRKFVSMNLQTSLPTRIQPGVKNNYCACSKAFLATPSFFFVFFLADDSFVIVHICIQSTANSNLGLGGRSISPLPHPFENLYPRILVHKHKSKTNQEKKRNNCSYDTI